VSGEKNKQNSNTTSRADYKTSLPWSPTADIHYVPFANNSPSPRMQRSRKGYMNANDLKHINFLTSNTYTRLGCSQLSRRL